MENQNIAYFLCFIFGIVYVDSIILRRLNRKILQSAKDNYKWIRREYRLLEALFKDYRGVVSSVGQIKQKASQAWDSDVAEISLQLDETQTNWLRKSGKVASDAKLQVRKYEKIMSEGDVLKKPSIVLLSLMSTLQLALELKKAKRKIVDHFDLHQNMSVQEIYESLDISGSKVRSLQDGPIDETDHPSISSRPSFRSGAALVSILKGLIAQKPDLVRGMAEQVRSAEIQLMLLYAFMKDLRGLRLEREIQNAWVGEAQLIIIETENVTNTFFLKTSHQAWWLSVLGNWTLRRKLKRKINHVVSRIRDLLEAKERYGFKFIRRESSKFEHPHPLLQLSSNDAVISSVTGRIRDQLSRGIAQVLDNVMGLCDQLEQTQELLRNTKAIEGARNTRAACFEQLQRLASDAQISTEMHMDRHSWFSLTFVAWSSFPSEVSGIEEVVNLLQRSIRMYSIEIIEDSSSVVGLEEDIHALVSKLTNNVKNDSIVAIVGMKGIGKTTLAKEIYNHVAIVNHFDVRRWFSLPQEINGNSLVIRNIERVLGTHEEKQEKEKRYLLVLDNLFSNKAWDVLKATFGDVGISGLKIVITTRYKAVASYANPSSIHQLRLRTKKESWEFFTQMVNVPSEVEALARKVVERTGGLPLAILHLGYLFAGKPVNSEGLSRVLERVTEGQNQTLWLDAWDINKEDLQSQPILGNCLSYFESFPIDFEIPARRLVALLVARGLVQSSNEYSNETHENVAYKYISELINRNMIQVVERKHNGKVKTCRFPSTLRELWVRRRREGGTVRSWYLVSTSLEGQLTYQFDDNDANFSRRIPGLHMNLPNFLHEERYPRSIMFFDTREGRQPGKDIGNFLHSGIKSRRFRDLLVLDLEGVFRPHLPGNIGELNQLTYLGLRWTYLETIPTSIGKLLNLQTLDVKYTYIRTLPISVWTLKKLRHLYLNEYCRIKFMPKPSAIHMKDLQTLSGVFLDGDSPLKDGLDKVNNLRKLGLAFQLTLPQQEVLAKLILQLTHLQSLSLSSVNEKSEPQDLKLEPLSGLQKLSSLYLFGKLERPCITSELPESLTELMLSASRLPEDPMLNLGKLPKLKSLSFFSDSYEGTCMLCLSDGFPQLLVLKLWSLNYLVSLCVEEGAMPNVREMEIRSCKKLKVTTGLTHLKTLQELKLTNMPKEYAADVRNGFAVAMEQCRRQIIHYPRIKIDNY